MPLSGTPTALGIPNFAASDRPMLDAAPGMPDITFAIDALLATRAVRLQDVVVGVGGANAIAFPAIPQTFKHLLIEMTARDTTVSAAVAITLRFNSDTTAAYDAEALIVAGAGTTPIETVAGTSGRIARAPAANAIAGWFSSTEIAIPDYAGTLGTKSAIGRTVSHEAAATGGILYELDAVGWRANAAITRIDLLALFAQGSHATLYGLP
jgi:hypothetical protein